MGFPIAAAAIIGGSSIIGGMLSRGGQDQPPNPPDYNWIKQYGPQTWNYLREQGYDLSQNPYGLGESKPYMQSVARGSASAGYGASQRSINQNLASTGMNPAGGSAMRQQYYAGQQFSEGLNRNMSAIEVQDAQMKDEQKQRGLNLLFSLTNKSPVYSQIAAQNYWNSLNAANAGNMAMYDSIGGAAGSMYDAYQYNQWMNENPYGNMQGGGGGGSSQYGGYNYGGTGQFDPWHAGPEAQYQMGTV
jgi:hypothetical protein